MNIQLIGYYKQQIKAYERLFKKAERKDRVEEVIKIYKQELMNEVNK